MDAGPSAAVPAEAPTKSPVEDERTQGSVKEVTSASIREFDGIGTGLAASRGRFYRPTRKLQALHLRLKADAPAEAPSKSLVDDEHTQGSVKDKVKEVKQMLSALIRELEGIRAKMAELDGRLSGMARNLQDIRLLLK